MPLVELFNRQRKKPIDLGLFRRFADLAMAKVLERGGQGHFPEEIIVVFVSDARIARIHRDFMAVDEPTDVITFRHGEIFISVDAAERQGEKYSGGLSRELRIYFVHGLLHLLGLDDLTEQGFEEMAAVQEAIVHEVEETLIEEERSSYTPAARESDETRFLKANTRASTGGWVKCKPTSKG